VSRISDAIRDGNGLICYVTAGFPSGDATVEHAMACVDGGADVIELGVPFSDPVADGKVIQHASQKALEAGMTPAKVFDIVERLRSRTDAPIILMGYYNPIFRMTEATYTKRTGTAGGNGLIVPDLPLEESANLAACCRGNGIDLVQLVGPTTTPERMGRIAASSSGFLYLVSSMGTTGARSELDRRAPELVARAKKAAGKLPLAVGFGVSRREHAVRLREAGADAVIVGSAIMQMVADGRRPAEVREYVRTLAGRGP